ncbi:MAG: hypothetical protein C0614_07275, partial [Desulfuromonas sp.]
PSFLTTTLPLAFLMGIMIGLSRLSADHETIALKAAGLSLARLATPVFLLALLFSLITGTIGIWGKAWGYRTFKSKIYELTQQKATIGLEPRIFMDQFPGLVLYANNIDDRTGIMEGLFVKESQSDVVSWVFARQGQVFSDAVQQKVTLRLQDGVIHRQQPGEAKRYQLIHFRGYDIQPDLGANFENGGHRMAPPARKLKPKELSFSELRQAINDTSEQKKLYALSSELHQRLTSPLAPLVFALFGLPFSIQAQRSGRSGGFVIGLLIYLIYYILWSLADTLTADVGVSPWLTFWLLHGILLAGGAYTLHLKSLERDIPLIDTIERALQWLKTRGGR